MLNNGKKRAMTHSINTIRSAIHPHVVQWMTQDPADRKLAYLSDVVSQARAIETQEPRTARLLLETHGDDADGKALQTILLEHGSRQDIADMLLNRLGACELPFDQVAEAGLDPDRAELIEYSDSLREVHSTIDFRLAQELYLELEMKDCWVLSPIEEDYHQGVIDEIQDSWADTSFRKKLFEILNQDTGYHAPSIFNALSRTSDQIIAAMEAFNWMATEHKHQANDGIRLFDPVELEDAIKMALDKNQASPPPNGTESARSFGGIVAHLIRFLEDADNDFKNRRQDFIRTITSFINGTGWTNGEVAVAAQGVPGFPLDSLKNADSLPEINGVADVMMTKLKTAELSDVIETLRQPIMRAPPGEADALIKAVDKVDMENNTEALIDTAPTAAKKAPGEPKL